MFISLLVCGSKAEQYTTVVMLLSLFVYTDKTEH